MRTRRAFFTASLLSLAAAASASCAPGDGEDDPGLRSRDLVTTRQALVAANSVSYRLPAEVMSDVLPDRPTELWAQVYRPEVLSTEGRHPVLLFLHGNHPTCGIGANPRRDNRCEYTETGTCPAGWTVVDNHLGYGYVATALAQQGYVVVSVNANRGITCGRGVPGDVGLNLARGRLVLKHLQKLSQWDKGLEEPPPGLADLRDRLDFQSVGLMGHSRGGEGVRAAYAQYRDEGSEWPVKIASPLRFQGIFEIAPVDGQAGRRLDALDVKWNVLLPMCDGDVSDLSGLRVFDRMVSWVGQEATEGHKSTFTVWGANHNYYNSEWQMSDSVGCYQHLPIFSTAAGVTGSAAQRETGRRSMLDFFRGAVGAQSDSTHLRLFNPLYPLPADLTNIARVDRGYTSAADSERFLRLDDFDQEPPLSSWGVPATVSGVLVGHARVPEHDATHRGATVAWTEAGASTFWQTNNAPAGDGKDLAGYRTLDLRVERVDDPMNPPAETTDFSVQLINADDSPSEKVAIAEFVSLTGPVGGPTRAAHPVLQTARIPLARFAGADLRQVRGVRLTFDRTMGPGKIYLANLRAHAGNDDDSLALAPLVPPPTTEPAPSVARSLVSWAPGTGFPQRVSSGNRLGVPRATGMGPTMRAAIVAEIEIEVRSAVEFPVRDALLTMRIGELEVNLSHYPSPGDLHRVVFTLTPEQYASVNHGDPVTVGFGPRSALEWDFGALVKR